MTTITIDRAIVEHALEALEWSWLIVFAAEAKLQRLHRSGEPTPASKAITALRAALADHIGEANEVVYQISMKDGAASSAWIDVDEAAYNSAKLYGEYKCRCLYTAPPQQPVNLQDIEQYQLQMAGICTAALGYWTEDNSIHPDYDTPALRDVAKLYAKYAALYAGQSQRKPLTDEEIHDCFQQSGKTKAETRRLITRAIEKMHGIGDA